MYSALIIVIFVILLYYALTNYLTYWKQNGVPQYSILTILIDNFEAFTKRQSIADVFVKYCKSFPNQRYFGIYQLFKKSLMVQDAELIKKITVKDFDHFVDHDFFCKGDEPLWDRNVFSLQGKAWKDMRVILSPCFTGRKMKIMFHLVLACSQQFIEHFKTKSKNRSYITVDISDATTRFSCDVISSIAFGYTCDSLKEPDNEFYINSRALLPTHDFLDNLKRFLILNVPKVAKFLRLRFFPKASSDYFLSIISDNVKTRRKTGIVRHDLINLLMNAKGMNITDVDITAQALIFYFAGVEATSTLLSFTLYELALQENLQIRLQKEVDETLNTCGGIITYEGLETMKYMDMVLTESLRKWPVTVLTDRVCTKPYVIQPEKRGEVPVYLKKGDVIRIPMYTIQRDPKVYSNPEQFDPERFRKENRQKLDPYANIPFGVGPRGCVARRFALIMMKLLLFQILENFEIVTVDKTISSVKIASLAPHLVPEGGIWLGLKSRDTRSF